MSSPNNDIRALQGRQVTHNFDICLTPDHDDYQLERVRRERVYAWHTRLGLPSYAKMKQAVRTSPGIDITEADVDLLPWNAQQRLDRREYERWQAESEAKVQTARRKFQDDERRRLREQRAKEKERARLEEEARRIEEERKRRLADAEARRRQEERERKRAAEEARNRAAAEAERKRLDELERRRKAEEARRQKADQARRLREEEERRRREAVELAKQEAEEAERQARLEQERLAKLKEEAELDRRREELERKRQRKYEEQLPPKLTNGESPVERAYRCFDLLGRPTRATLFAAKDKLEGLELADGDLETLPWTKDQKTLKYPKLHQLLQREERKRQVRQPIMNVWIKGGGEGRMSRPDKAEMKESIAEWTRGELTADDVSLMSWDDDEEVLVQHDNTEDGRIAAKMRKQVMERKWKEEEERARHMEPVLRRKRRSQRPPPVTLGNTPLERAYRWYTRLSGPHRRELYRSADEGVDLQRSDIDTLPWIRDGALLDFALLGQMLEDIETNKKRGGTADDGSGTMGTANQAERRRLAYNWYKKLKRPNHQVFVKLVEETFGTNLQTQDVDLLPWNDDQTAIVEARLPKNLREGRSSRRKSIGHSFGK
eukprot:CAMPEP_0168751288 /NCGR_PEP_ID=MMETSP0724-20121128/17744_1 /TAXON_ID=265536 /ORGANISM="Amphiprora sp., Strain CCMP467" /LENGTH=604 /DNA_ID=CAMNT_0008799403 /DNA_START=104 /DNA_END=1918 /DNA_ORIENTATION=+